MLQGKLRKETSPKRCDCNKLDPPAQAKKLVSDQEKSQLWDASSKSICYPSIVGLLFLVIGSFHDVESADNSISLNYFAVDAQLWLCYAG